MSDIVDTSPLGIERTERIAGDDALNSRLDNVTTELQGTQASVTTEVLHRSEGDLVIQRVLEGYIQDLLEGKAEDFERYIEFQNSQNLNYADVRNFVSGIRTSLADDIRGLSTSLMNNLQANDARYDKLVSDVGRYLEILSDITLDSNQITLDNGELRAGAWTILSQARAWDLEIINRLNGLSASVGDSLKDAVEEIQNQLPSTEETITKAIEELSKSPLIKELSDLLNQSIENDIAYELALLEQARKHANEMSQLAEDMRAEALAKAQEMEDYMAGEVTARITEVNKEVAARKEAIDALTEDMLTRVDQDKADYQADMLAAVNRIKSAEDGLTSEIQHRKDGDTSTLNALNTYKVSNDSAITGLTTSLSNNVTKTSANTTLITGLTSRLETAEDGIDSATTAAADAMSKATTAVTANSALATRVDALAASITESEGTVVDVNAFNALKAEVNTVKGTVTGLVEDITALETNYTSVNNKVTTQGTAISTLNTKMSTAENSISQSANDITLLKTDINTVNAGLLTKVDSQAFSQLSSDVTELDDKYTTQASLVTDLRGSLDTTNVNVGNATTAAQNALTAAGSKGKVIFGTSAPATADRLSQNLWIDTTGGANTPKRWNGSTWVVVTDKVATDALAAANAATILVNTKADTSAFNSLDQKVTVMDGKVSTNTNSITSLSGKIDIVEGGLATKLDSSALVNYYTKQEADDNALSTAAGEISKYDASLVIGGTNLYSGTTDEWQEVVFGGWQSYLHDLVISPNGSLSVGDEITWSGEILDEVNSASLMLHFVVPSIPLGYIQRHSSWAGAGEKAIVKGTTTVPEGATAVRMALRHDIGSAPISAFKFRRLQIEKGSKATDWSPSPKDTQASLDANATAIQDTKAEVLRVDGRVTTTSNQITSLTGRVDIVESGLSLKADVAALSSLYTKAQSDAKATEIAAGEVNKFSASLQIGGDNLANGFEDGRLLALSAHLGSTTTVELMPALQPEFSSTSTPFKLISSGGTNKIKSTPLMSAFKSANVVLSFKARNVGTKSVRFHFNGLNNQKIVKGGSLTLPAGSGIVEYVITGTFRGDYDWIQFQPQTITPADTIEIVLADIQLEVGNTATSWKLPTAILLSKTEANATAITTTNAEVERVDGRVTTEANRITTLSGRVSTVEGGLATKADVAAMNALTTRVGEVEGGLSTQANNTTALEAKLSVSGKGGTNLLYKSNKFGSYNGSAYPHVVYQMGEDWEVGATYTLMFCVEHKRGAGDSNSSLGVYAGGGTQSVVNYSNTGGKTVRTVTFVKTSAGTAKVVNFYMLQKPSADKGSVGDVYWAVLVKGRVLTTDEWVPSPYEHIEDSTANASAVSSTNTEVSRIDDVVTGHVSDIRDLKTNIAGKADASAVSTLSAQVDIIDGRVSTHAESLLVLQSDNDTNKNALTVQGRVIDGVKSSYMVKMETNGVIGGFGLMQSTGALGQVKTSFGVNADSFFIGAPASQKQPFIVTTTNQVVNGVTYPAGTYIDVALIANATIGTAHIANASITNAKIKDLDAAKITTGTLDAGRIRVGSSTQFDSGFAPTDVLNDAKSYVDSNTGNLVNNPSVSGTRERWSSGTVTTQDFLGTAVPVLTLTSSGDLQVTCGNIDVDPAKAYEVSVWVKKSAAVGSTYLGLNARNAAGSTIAVNSVNQSGGTSLSNNFYHWSVSAAANPLDWIKLVAYVMPAGTDPLDMKKVGNVTTNAFMLPNTRKLQMRLLNYYNGGTSTSAWFANPKIVEVDPNAVIAASKAQILADSKTQTFTAQPTTPYTSGDIYRNGASIYVCTTSRASGSYVAADWTLVGDVTANNTAADANKLGGTAAATVLDNAAKGIAVYNDVMSDLKITPVEKTAINQEWNRIQKEYASLLAQAQALSITTTTYAAAYTGLSTTAPAMSTILASMNTTTTLTAAQRDAYKSQYTTYYTQAVAITKAINDKIAANAKAQADAKSKTFTSQPVTPYTAGDLWKDGTTIRVCTVSRASGSYVAADWTLVGDVTSANTAANSNQLGGKAAATVLSDITNAKSAADAASNQLTLWKYPNTTEIDGGKIRTNSVTANQISVSSLSAISANIGLFKTATTGKRVEISDNGFRMYNASGIVVVELGDF